LPHLTEYNRLRRQHAKKYKELLAGLPVKTPTEQLGNQHIYHMYVIQAPRRDELQVWLKDHGIGTGIHYPVPIHLQNAMSNLGGKKGDFPVTEKVVDQILSLPLYPELTDEAIQIVASSIRDFYNQK
jgi:dTDP-4-amino-4,6-dideoxygalactose transaminase